ncbi:MAG: hypothetical protein H5T68_03635 [Chloroflexi bacterium]|nr:hypothetical protein [Chloroflexota bacterium]
MDRNLLQQVRAACKTVAERASHVHINYPALPSYAATLPLEQLAQPQHDPASHYLGHGEDTVAFFLTLDAINFGSGYFPHLRKRPGMSGYFTIASSLTDYFATYGPFSAHQLARLTAADCLRIFAQDPDNAPIYELMQLFATALNDLGRYLLQQFDGSFVRLVEYANASAERLVQLLTEMPFFNDVSSYGDLQVPFYKRAQITAADLWIAFEGQGPGRFDDLEQLTIFADNLVPHVLRMDGVLQYEDDLAQRIDHEELIPAGSAEEVEIRACAVLAVELLSMELRQRGKDVPPMKLDYLLWNRGQQPHYKAHPRHRTRTVYY